MKRQRVCQSCGGPQNFMLDGVLQQLCYQCYYRPKDLTDNVARIEYLMAEEATLCQRAIEDHKAAIKIWRKLRRLNRGWNRRKVA